LKAKLYEVTPKVQTEEHC